jgi:hypothetical protein
MKNHILSLALLTAAAHAGRTSADYAIATDTLDSGGQHVGSSAYSGDGSITTVTGISSDSEPVQTVARHGYIGQLYERLGLGLLASDFYPPEEGTTQFTAVHTNDDGSNDPIPSESVTWSLLGGPITGINTSGLATTGIVHESTEAIVGATVFGTPLQLSVYVQDTLPDNYGLYAGDGIDDAWQKLHFGLENPLAAPLLDPDGDGQNNRFEFVAGVGPLDPNSRFSLRIEPVPGEPTRKDIVFSPVFPDRVYTVLGNPLMAGPWHPLATQSDDLGAPERRVTDLGANGPEMFYRVEITR